MALPVWGNLEKSQVDPEKIEEAIARLIQAHEDDPDAHVEVGESLYSHKAAEIIDHLIASIIADKIKDNEIYQRKLTDKEIQLYTCFESLDGWDKSGAGIITSLLGTTLQTSDIINTERFMIAESMGDGEWHDWTQDIFFQTQILFGDDSNQLIYFGALSYQDDETDIGFGFKVISDYLYAVILWSDGFVRHEKTIALRFIDTFHDYAFRAFFDASEQKIYFYVDDVLEHTETVTMPSTATPVFFTYSIENKAAINRILYIRNLLYSRER